MQMFLVIHPSYINVPSVLYRLHEDRTVSCCLVASKLFLNHWIIVMLLRDEVFLYGWRPNHSCRFPSVAPIMYGTLFMVWHMKDHVQLELKNWFHCKFLLCFGLWKLGWKPSIIHEIQGQKLVGTWDLGPVALSEIPWNMQCIATGFIMQWEETHYR